MTVILLARKVCHLWIGHNLMFGNKLERKVTSKFVLSKPSGMTKSSECNASLHPSYFNDEQLPFEMWADNMLHSSLDDRYFVGLSPWDSARSIKLGLEWLSTWIDMSSWLRDEYFVLKWLLPSTGDCKDELAVFKNDFSDIAVIDETLMASGPQTSE